MPKLIILILVVLSGCVGGMTYTTPSEICWLEGYYWGARIYSWEHIFYPEYYRLWWRKEWLWKELDRLETSRAPEVYELYRENSYDNRWEHVNQRETPTSESSSTQCSADNPCKQFKVR